MWLTVLRWGRPGGVAAAVAMVMLGLGSQFALADEAPPKTGAIAGVVTDAASGAVVADAEVRMFPRTEVLRNRLQVQLSRVRTDAAGRYRFENVAPGEYRVYAVQGTRASRNKPLGQARALVTADGTSSPVNLTLTEAQSLKVRVVSEETGQPIPQALVRLRWTDLDDNAVTNQDGIALIHGLPRNDQFIEAMAPGFQQMELIQTLKDPLTEVQLVLPPGGYIPGRVVDEQGKPLEGVRVTAAPTRVASRYHETTSDKDGKFRLDYVPTSKTIKVITSIKDYYEGVEQFSLNGAPYRPLDLTLRRRPRGGDVEVTVVDGEGRPIAGVEVINSGASQHEEQQTKTDESGQAALSNLYLPLRLDKAELTFRAEGFAPKVVMLDRSKEGPAKITVDLEKGHRLRGRVVNAAGEPISDAKVHRSDGNRGGYRGHGITLPVDSEGRFSTTTAIPGSLLVIEAPGYTTIREEKIELDQEEERVYTLDELGHFRGVVVDATTKKPVRNFKVKLDFPRMTLPEGLLRPAGGMPVEWMWGRTFTDDAGRFLWEDLANRTAFDVTIEAEGFEPARLSHAVTHRDESEHTFELKPIDPGSLIEVAGVILDPKGDPIEGADVHLIGMDPETVKNEPRRALLDMPLSSLRGGYARDAVGCRCAHAAVTAPDGTFRFPKVTNGIHLQLVYWGPDTPPTRIRDLEKQPADRLKQMEIITLAPATVKGKINLARYPNPGRIHVQVASDPRESQMLDLDASNRSQYTISKLAPGELKLMLLGEKVERRENGTVSYTYAPLAMKSVTVKAGETLIVDFDE